LQQTTSSVKHQSYAGAVRQLMIEITGVFLLYWETTDSLFNMDSFR